nr:hypothetical protein OH820_10840 [Streptomyces sp. NBC_00857]
MPHRVARVFESLVRLLRPASGRHRPRPASGRHRRDRHRSAGPVHDHPLVDTPTVPLPRFRLLRGEDSPLVRPYLLAHEERQRAYGRTPRRRTPPRRELWFAVRGVDFGPRPVNHVTVTT